MSDMVRCPCCGITSGGGDNPKKRYYSLLRSLARCAKKNGDQAEMVVAAKEYLRNVTTGVSSSDRPNRIPYIDDVEDLREAFWLLEGAIKLEGKNNE